MAEKKTQIRLEDLPFRLREAALKLDADGSGTLDMEEIAEAISSLSRKQKENHNLKKTIGGFVALIIFLVAAVFGASITAARLSQDIYVSHDNGFAYIKGTDHNVMKTSEAFTVEEIDSNSLIGMDNEFLDDIEEISLKDGDVKFVVKGYARDFRNNEVVLLVEGGTLTYGDSGIVGMTGTAKDLVGTTIGFGDAEMFNDFRQLGAGCSSTTTKRSGRGR